MKNLDQNNLNTIYEDKFINPIKRSGRFWNLIGVLFSFIPAIYISIRYNAFPGVENILKGWSLIVSIFGVYYIVEPVSYFPVLGLPGTYFAFISGNLGNMRVPAAAIAQETTKVEPGTKKAELIELLK